MTDRTMTDHTDIISKLATHLDLPPELLIATAPPPSPTQRSPERPRVQEETCDLLTTEVLHPALRRAGVPNPEQFRLDYTDDPETTR